jgi:uncharacterized protein (TIGR02646 family)
MIFTRRESPPPFNDHRSYAAYLRRDFRNRCAYCERPEPYLDGPESFTVDHFRPISNPEFRHLRSHYSNLYYCCRRCNEYKWKHWPSDQEAAEGARFSDPCVEDMYVDHLRESPDGSLVYLTPCGRYTLARIRLNRDRVVAWRRRKRNAERTVRDAPSIFAHLRQLLNLHPEQQTRIREEISSLESLVSETKERYAIEASTS